MTRRLPASLFLCLLLSACSGGGTASLPQTQLQAKATGGGSTSISFAIHIPALSAAAAATKRHPLYISQKTQSVAIAVNSGTPVVANLAAGSPICTGTPGQGRTCTIAISAPVGADTFSEVTFATPNGTGAPLSQNTTTATIVAGQANSVSITLDGIVASIALSLANTAPPVGSAVKIPLTVNFYDAAGAAIIGSDPFANAIALSDSDTSGATVISDKSLNSPADAAGLSVAYSGAAIGQAIIGASAAGVAGTSVTTTTLTPQSQNSSALVDWPTYGYDAQRSGFNPYSTGITPAALSKIRLGWQVNTGGRTQTQPIIATNVAGHQALLIIGSYVTVKAYDALTGALVWSRQLPAQSNQDCGSGGITGTVQYVKSLNALFMAAGNGGGPNHIVLYRLDVGTGGVTGQVDTTPELLAGEANFGHTAVTYANGRLYLGTGSSCEGTTTGLPSWRGRVVAVDPASMTLLKTFFTTWGQGGSYGGGGVWAWGGVSSDANGNVYFATGNSETTGSVSEAITAPFVAAPTEQAGYGEHLVQISPDLSTVENANYPGFNFSIGGGDLDYAGTPVVYQPPVTAGCGARTATQGKGGTLVVNSAGSLAEINSFALSVPSGEAYYMGNPAYSPNSGYLYAAITSSGQGSSLLPPGLAAIDGCGSGIVWHTQFGPDALSYDSENPRSAPTVTAGGVVFLGTPCTANGNGGCGGGGTAGGALWAVDGTTGSMLNGGSPIVITKDIIRMAPSVDGLWVYVVDQSGNMYGYTVDASVPPAAVQRGRLSAPTFRIRGIRGH